MKPSRRQFALALGSAGAAAAGISELAGAAPPARTFRAPHRVDVPTAVRSLHRSLSARQRRHLVLGAKDERRFLVDSNYAITSPELGSNFYTAEQRHLVGQLVASLTSSEGYQRLSRQLEDDAGGLSGFHMAFFEAPAETPAGPRGPAGVEWQMTGRHLTLRARSDQGSLVRGCTIYGHGAWEPKDSLYFDQSQAANRLFQSLNAAQRSLALRADAPYEEDVQLSSPSEGFRLSGLEQKQHEPLQALVRSLARLFEPRFERLLKQRMLAPQPLASSTLTFYREDDLGSDGHWDLWRLQGPGFVWHYRGAPHVHAYINLA